MKTKIREKLCEKVFEKLCPTSSRRQTSNTADSKNQTKDTHEKGKIRFWGIFFILLGLAITFVSLLVELTNSQARPQRPMAAEKEASEQHSNTERELSKPVESKLATEGKPPAQPPNGESDRQPSVEHKPPLDKVFIEFFKHVGLAFFSIGVVSCLLEMRHWTEYFKQRLADVVVEHTYLEKLSDPQIQDLQLKTWKRLFKGPHIDREGSFLKHFENRIQDLIGSPYREGTIERMLIENCDDDDDIDSFRYTTTVTYRCRQVQGKLQQKVSWIPERGEFIKVNEIKFELEVKDHPALVSPIVVIPLQAKTWPADQLKAAQPRVTNGNRTYTFDSDLLLKHYSFPGLKGDAKVQATDTLGPPSCAEALTTAVDPDLTNNQFSVPLEKFKIIFTSQLPAKAKYQRRASLAGAWDMLRKASYWYVSIRVTLMCGTSCSALNLAMWTKETKATYLHSFVISGCCQAQA